MMEDCGQGAVHGNARTLAVKAGVSLAKPAMVIIPAVMVCLCMFMYVVLAT